jgi:CBS-domain-containing membrane protein
MGRASFEITKQFLANQHLAPLLQRSSQQLATLNKWSTAGQALQVGANQPPKNLRQQQRCPQRSAHHFRCMVRRATFPSHADALPYAVQLLATANVLSAPVLDEDQEYYGCLSVNDLLKDLDHSEWQLLQASGSVLRQVSHGL